MRSSGSLWSTLFSEPVLRRLRLIMVLYPARGFLVVAWCVQPRMRDVDNLQVLTVLRSKRSIQYFSGTNFLPLSDAWSSYAPFIERLGSFTFSRGTFL